LNVFESSASQIQVAVVPGSGAAVPTALSLVAVCPTPDPVGPSIAVASVVAAGAVTPTAAPAAIDVAISPASTTLNTTRVLGRVLRILVSLVCGRSAGTARDAVAKIHPSPARIREAA
jgi:hypothetical protein